MRLAGLLGPLQYANIAGALLLICVLLFRGLYRSYRWFFVYLCFDVLESFAALVPLSDRLSLDRYILLQAVKTTLASLVVIEIYRLALEERKALARFGRNLVAYVFGGSFLVAFAGLFFLGDFPRSEWKIHYTLGVEGVVDSAQLLFLGIMVVFLTWFPVRLRRNLIAYILGFAVYFVARWTILLLAFRSVGSRQILVYNFASFSVTLVCLVFWIWAMRTAGEKDTTTMGHRWNPEEMGRLKTQLDEINDNLERLVR